MPFTLSLDEGKLLVRLARNAAKEYLKTGKQITAPQSTSKNLFEQRGVFVTINKKEQLRGCIGYPYPTIGLVEAVINSAIAAATQDPRFYPVLLDEIDELIFEVSVLTPPEEIEVEKSDEYKARIKIGEDGLIVEKGIRKGLLLPQVPVELKWDVDEFLCQCCIKAGLPVDCWLTQGTKIYKFQAEVFKEEKPNGKVVRVHLKG